MLGVLKMQLKIIGDTSKMSENFTRAMFEIVLNRIKEGKEIIPSTKDTEGKTA
jgi:hypothetical protein